MATPQQPAGVPLLTQGQAAAILNLANPRTLAAWRLRRCGPAYVRLGRAVRYRPADVEAFIAARTCPGEGTSPPAAQPSPAAAAAGASP